MDIASEMNSRLLNFHTAHPLGLLDPERLAQAMVQARQDTLDLLDDFADALGDRAMSVPQRAEVNPPLWEFGHVAWFTDHWIRRNPGRALGVDADTEALALGPEPFADADALYNSAVLAHGDRWAAGLRDLPTLRQDLRRGLQTTLELLRQDATSGATPDPLRSPLYFHRLCLAHELMHREAFLMTARLLDIPTPRLSARLPERLPTAAAVTGDDDGASPPLAVKGGVLALEPSEGFAFDNEFGGLRVDLAPIQVDARPVLAREYLEFLDATGASPEERARFRQANPRNDRAACHLRLDEALAYCRWAGRRLPTEAEWLAASEHPDFVWGEVWEWTGTPFEPWPGFRPHPYREYSEPWFGDHQVVKGAAHCTHPLLRHRGMRNFYQGHRADVFIGFRTVALQSL